MWADIGQFLDEDTASSHRSGIPRDTCLATAINHNHFDVFMPGRLMSHAAPDTPVFEVSPLLLPYRHMPMLVLNAARLQADGRVNCCYLGDGGTNRRLCATPGGNSSCVPGCSGSKERSIEKCVAKSQVYNEIVLDTFEEGGWGNSPRSGMGRYIDALALDVHATQVAVNLTLAVQLAAQQAGMPLVLLSFDSIQRAAPFAPHSLSLH
jgi:hypothetical protein